MQSPISSPENSPGSRRPQERFGDYLQSRQMRNTRQREFLLEVVTKQVGPFDADQLIERLPIRGKSNHVSRPTVYRTLNEFVDAGLLRKFELNGRSLYQQESGDEYHDHMYCVECKQFMAFQSETLVELRNQVAAEHQFQVQSHRLIVNGICNECRLSKRRKRRRVDLI